jgi:outer membrane protein, multidrug efflux system
VLNALREVEDALVAYRTDRAGRNKLAEAVRSGERALYLARDSYTHGIWHATATPTAWPISSRCWTPNALIGSRRQLIQTDVMLTDDVVSLCDALGGGWQDTTAGLQPPPVNTAPPMVPAALDSLAAAPPR